MSLQQQCGQAILLSIIIWLGWGMINCNPGGILGTLLFEVSRFAKNGWSSTLMFTWIIPTPMCLVDKKTSLILNDECKKFHPWMLLYIYFIIVTNYLTIILQPGRYFSLFFELWLWYSKGRYYRKYFIQKLKIWFNNFFKEVQSYRFSFYFSDFA